MKKTQIVLIGCVVSTAMLLIALADNPYGYYQVLRIIVTATAGYMVYIAYIQKQYLLLPVLLVITVLFNPIFPIFLERDIWAILDIVSGIAILISTFKLNKKL